VFLSVFCTLKPVNLTGIYARVKLYLDYYPDRQTGPNRQDCTWNRSWETSSSFEEVQEGKSRQTGSYYTLNTVSPGGQALLSIVSDRQALP
jgi:hypothetical protein